MTSNYFIPGEETLDRPALIALQRVKLAALLQRVRASNAFYQRKLAGVAFDAGQDPLEKLPLLKRAEIEADQAQSPPFGTNLTEPIERCIRLHQTSGSSGGRPM